MIKLKILLPLIITTVSCLDSTTNYAHGQDEPSNLSFSNLTTDASAEDAKTPTIDNEKLRNTTAERADATATEFPWPLFLPAIINKQENNNLVIFEFEYPGRWAGSFSGTDTGNWLIDIESDGKLSGLAYSDDLRQTVDLSGTVTSGGEFEAQASGTGNSGATFIGTISEPGVINGTWDNVEYSNESGTFEGEYRKDQKLLTVESVFDNAQTSSSGSCSITIGHTVGYEISPHPSRTLYDSGSYVMHSIKVNSTGCAFVGYSGDCTGTDTCYLTMDSDKDVVAHYQWVP